MCHKHVGKNYAEHVNEESRNAWVGLSNYLKMRSDKYSPHTGSEKNTFALSLSKSNSLPTHGVLR